MTVTTSTPHGVSPRPTSLGELRASGYRPRTVREEMRANLIAKIRRGDELFPGVVGYDQTVIPQIENAILSGQDIIFLGERGQAKTRLARSLVNLLDECDPDRRRLGDQRRPVRADLALRARPGRRAGRRHADRVGRPRPPLRREAGHAGHDDRRPDRRGRPDQGRRGALPVRRADDLLRADPAHQPRHLHPQRAAGPGRADPGRSAQHHGGARRPDPRLQDPPAAGRLRRRLGQPGGLHQPRPHHHPARRTATVRRSAPTTRRRSSSRSRSWSRSGRIFETDGIADDGAGVHEGDRRRADPPGAPLARRLPALRRLGADDRRQLREPDLERDPAGDPARREAGGTAHLRSGRRCYASTTGKIELETLGEVREEQIVEKLIQQRGRRHRSTATSRSASSSGWSWPSRTG